MSNSESAPTVHAEGKSVAAGADIFDLSIIGGGPAGLFAAYYAGMRRMRVKIIDSLDELGGQLTALYPEKYIFDVAGFPKVMAKDLAGRLIEQAMQYSPALALGEVVQTLEEMRNAECGMRKGDEAGHAAGVELPVYRVTTDKGVHYTRTLLICAGAGAFSPRKLNVAGAAELEGRGVYYAVRNKAEFAGKDVLVVGGGDSAVDWSLNLQDVAGAITLIHRRNVFRAAEHNLRRLQATAVSILTFWELREILGEEGRVTGAVIEYNQTQEVRRLAVEAVLAQIGFNSSLGAIKHWPLVIEHGGIKVNHVMETNMPGIYAAGDVAAYEGKLKLIATGFGEAAIAVNHAKTRIVPGAKMFPGHSSEMVPQHGAVVV
jgi:ferredoxin/flavodoxin---NADP+ reductase